MADGLNQMYIYILRSKKNNRLYVGSTEDVRLRLQQHNKGENKSTKAYRPWELAKVEEFEDKAGCGGINRDLSAEGISTAHLPDRYKKSWSDSNSNTDGYVKIISRKSSQDNHSCDDEKSYIQEKKIRFDDDGRRLNTDTVDFKKNVRLMEFALLQKMANEKGSDPLDYLMNNPKDPGCILPRIMISHMYESAYKCVEMAVKTHSSSGVPETGYNPNPSKGENCKTFKENMLAAAKKTSAIGEISNCTWNSTPIIGELDGNSYCGSDKIKRVGICTGTANCTILNKELNPVKIQMPVLCPSDVCEDDSGLSTATACANSEKAYMKTSGDTNVQGQKSVILNSKASGQ